MRRQRQSGIRDRSQLYRRSIDPGATGALVAPADVAGLLVRAAAMDPWTKFPGMSEVWGASVREVHGKAKFTLGGWLREIT